jgi:hypothetical protein
VQPGFEPADVAPERDACPRVAGFMNITENDVGRQKDAMKNSQRAVILDNSTRADFISMMSLLAYRRCQIVAIEQQRANSDF